MKKESKMARPTPSDPVLSGNSLHNNITEDAFIISADDIMEMGQALGASFNRPRSQLKERIESILSSQKVNWTASQR